MVNNGSLAGRSPARNLIAGVRDRCEAEPSSAAPAALDGLPWQPGGYQARKNADQPPVPVGYLVIHGTL
jgi:hypothetical protein